jgi:(R)-2-hydroxyacyl-CoA dehydratese activating ATPase
MSEQPVAPPLYCGVDLGASATKVVVVDAYGAMVGSSVRPSGVDYRAAALAGLNEALAQGGYVAAEIARTVSTGYGRDNVGFADEKRTEIQCHGVGVYSHVRRAVTVVDVGGQDNKIIRLDDAGHRLHFRMNRKCAAGTGAFLEEVALRLDLPVGALDALAAGSTTAVQLSSFCTVFAKTEILAHLRRGVPIGAIVRGAFAAVVSRVVEMDPLPGEVVLTGGVVAHNPTVAVLLQERLGRAVTVPPHPQLMGALGAALVALKGPERSTEEGSDA